MDSVVLQLFQQKQLALANPVCQVVLNTPNVGNMFGMGAMAWHLLDENNKTEVKNYVQNSSLKLLYYWGAKI